VFQTKGVKKVKTHILCSATVCLVSRLYGIMWGKCVAAGRGQKRCGSRRTWKTFNTLLHVHGHKGYANAPRCYVIRTVPVLPPGQTSEQWLYQPYHWRHYTSNAFDVHWPKRNDGPCSVISIVVSGCFGKSISVESVTWKDVPTAAIFNRTVNNAETWLPPCEVTACTEQRCSSSGVCCLLS